MKISDLIEQYTQLDIIDNTDAWINLVIGIDRARIHMDSDLGNDFANQLSTLYATYDGINSIITAKKLDILGQIQTAEQSLLGKIKPPETHAFIKKWDLYIHDHDYKVICNRLQNYTDWRLPGMLIRPRRMDMVDILVPMDPLYLVDTNEEIINEAIMNHHENYANRIRPYVITDDGLHDLPDGQFGLVVAFEFFNFRNLQEITQYFAEIFSKLRPGGVFGFSFNDCSKSAAAVLAESDFCSYIPKRLLMEVINDIGFISLYQLSDPDIALTWMELQKPGEIHTIRGGQTFAKIV